jgi:hypothetical protein
MLGLKSSFLVDIAFSYIQPDLLTELLYLPDQHQSRLRAQQDDRHLDLYK